MLNLINLMAENYQQIKPGHIVGKVNLVIDGVTYHLDMTETNVSAYDGAADGEFITLIMGGETFQKLHDGTWTGLTAAGRENLRQSAPIDFRLPPGVALNPELMQTIYHLGMHCFKTELPHTYRFGPGHTRKIHGGNATALAYGPGVRFAYYTISGEEQINDEETRDPMDQFISVIGGEGIGIIDGREVKLYRGVAVHVPPGATHIFRAKPGCSLEMFWLAYGVGA